MELTDTSSYKLTTTVFVWGLYFGVAALAVGFTLKYGSPLPVGDEWNAAASMSSTQDVWNWVWHASGERRAPFRFIRWMIYRYFDGDLRIGQGINLVALVLTPLVLLLSIRRFRGHLALNDAVIPLLFLSLSHAVEFLHFNKASFIWPSCIVCVVFVYALESMKQVSTYRTFMLAGLLCVLPFLGAAGLIYTPFAVFAAGVLWSTSGSGFRERSWLRTLLLVSLLISSIAFLVNAWATAQGRATAVGVGETGDGKSIGEFVVASLAFVSSSSGPLAKHLWPLLGLLPVLLAMVSLFFIVLDVVRGRRQSGWPATAISGSFIGSTLVLAVVIGSIRDAASTRYVMLAVPLLISVYWYWLLSPRRVLHHSVHIILFLWVVTQLWYHASWAMDVGRERAAHTRELLGDVGDDLPTQALVARHASYWTGGKEASFESGLLALKTLQVSHFRNLQDHGLTEPILLSLDSVVVKGGKKVGESAWKLLTPEARIVLTLPEARRRVQLLQLEYEVESGAGNLPLRIEWLPDTVITGWPEIRTQYTDVNLRFKARIKKTSFWVTDTMSQVAILPGLENAVFRLHRVLVFYGEDP